MLKTVIFDMDGVIVDTEPVHYYAFMKHFEELNLKITTEEYATFTGNSTKNVYEKIKNKYNIIQNINDLIDRKRYLFNEAFDSKKDLFLIEGIERLIKHLYKNKIQLILASSSAKVTINKVFTRFNLHQYFSYIVSGEDFPQSKPDPAIFLEAQRLSNNKKNECLVIEDAYNGIIAAKKAGLFCIAYDSFHSKLQDLSLADYQINDFSQLDYIKLNNYLNKN